MAAGELELVHDELVSPTSELVDTFCLTRQKTSTAATYRSSCGRFASWLVTATAPGPGRAVRNNGTKSAAKRSACSNSGGRVDVCLIS
jgi:hypothetical protein